MSSVNKVILLGRVGKDPEARTIDGGKQVANFTIATSEKYNDKNGERKETTEWHNIVVWGKLAEIVIKYTKKGDQIYVEGSKKTRSWEKDGVTKYATDIVVNNLTLLGGNSNGTAAPNDGPTDDAFVPGADDLPF